MTVLHRFLNKIVFPSLNIIFANSVDTDEMPHLMWHFIYVFTVCQCIYLGVTSNTNGTPGEFLNKRKENKLFNVYFDNMVSQIYPSELQLNKANASDTEAAFLDLHLSISNDIVSTKIYDKRDDFDFEIVNFPFLDGDVPRSTSYGVYISQLIRFARASSYVADFNTRNKLLTQELLKLGYRYHKLRKTFSKFY